MLYSIIVKITVMMRSSKRLALSDSVTINYNNKIMYYVLSALSNY